MCSRSRPFERLRLQLKKDGSCTLILLVLFVVLVVVNMLVRRGWQLSYVFK